MSERLNALRRELGPLRIDAFFVTVLPHLRYISGFSGSNGLGLVTGRRQVLITDGRYADQVKHEAPGWKACITSDTIPGEMEKRKLLKAGMRIGFDGNAVTYAQFQDWKRRFPRVRFIPKTDVIERLAVVKDETEIASIRRAVEITDRVFFDILPLLKPGVAESDIAAEIGYRHRLYGAEGDGFETIVASGPRGALPHGKASSKKLGRREAVTLDFGCTVAGYHSDLTRTIGIGRPPAEIRKIYAVVLEAQRRAIDAAHAGMVARDLDAVARSTIERSGYGRWFRHSLGHGIGLQIHEGPRISVLSRTVLREGNVITIEPGIYIPGLGGVRIEDDIVIRNGGCEVLNAAPKEFITL